MNSPAISERELRYRQRYNGKEVLTAFLFLLPLLVGIILFFIVPIVETFYYSFTRWKGIGTAPVSYTHLDVYKRQGEPWQHPHALLSGVPYRL